MKKAFSLIEIIVVIAIIGILSSFVLVSLTKAREKAYASKARIMTKEIRNAVVMLEGDTNRWPGNKKIDHIESGSEGVDNELWDLTTPEAGLLSTNGSFQNWKGPYLLELGKDPWGNDYFFDTDYDIQPGPGEKWAAVIGSFGPNGAGQNIYDSDDIYELIVSE